MLKQLRYVLLGMIFGIVLTKSEAISWFRMQEMFHFLGFQIFGIFMTAVPVGAISIWLIRKLNIKTLSGEEIVIPEKKFHKGYVIGSIIFGIGWAFTGSCPGPIYVQVGSGYTVAIITLLSALAGNVFYSAIKKYLPH